MFAHTHHDGECVARLARRTQDACHVWRVELWTVAGFDVFEFSCSKRLTTLDLQAKSCSKGDAPRDTSPTDTR